MNDQRGIESLFFYLEKYLDKALFLLYIIHTQTTKEFTMGYTHYWSVMGSISKTNMNAMLDDVDLVVKKHRDIIQYESYDDRDPLVSPLQIRFNGIDDLGCETFSLDFPSKGDFCKTGRYPYDLPVCIILLIVKGWFGNKFDFSSDGFWGGELDENWPEAISFVTAMGYKVTENWIDKGNGKKKCKITVKRP